MPEDHLSSTVVISWTMQSFCTDVNRAMLFPPCSAVLYVLLDRDY